MLLLFVDEFTDGEGKQEIDGCQQPQHGIRMRHLVEQSPV